MEEKLSTGLRPTKDIYSFEISPELQAINTNVASKHDQEIAPLAKAVSVIGNPNAQGEEKVKAIQEIKPFTNRSDFRAADFIQSVLNLNVRDAIISATGGTHTRAEAYDQNGNKYYKVFNQRITKQNPYGEVVGYEDTKFQPLKPKDLEGKIIVSTTEIPLTQRPFYKANNITAEAAAVAQAEKRPQFINNPPGIGIIETEIARDPFVRSRKDQAVREITEFERQIKPIQEQINKQTVAPELLIQPSIAQTNRGSSASAKPVAPPTAPVSTAPARSAPPPPARTLRPLGAIFGQ